MRSPARDPHRSYKSCVGTKGNAMTFEFLSLLFFFYKQFHRNCILIYSLILKRKLSGMRLRRGKVIHSNTRDGDEERVHSSSFRFSKQKILVVIIIMSCAFIGFTATHNNSPFSTVRTTTSRPFRDIQKSSLTDYDVPEECKQLPFIRPMGTYFLDDRIGVASSTDGVKPSFKIGSNFGKQATKHMSSDVAHFQLIKELLKDKEGGITLDMGANQGFFTWYLATLGMSVHSFEIFEQNVKALQQGAEYNPPEVSNRVHIYPVGLGESTGRMSMGGKDYGGHLSNKKTGPILTTSFDCFAYHKLNELGNDLISNVAFVKLDVEGFEIAVLRGAKKSLFGPNGRIGGMLVEVGPSRWSRSNVGYDAGVAEMKELSTHFQNSHLIVRTGGGHVETCPESLARNLANQKPRIMEGVKIYKLVPTVEMEPVLKELLDTKGDCNFWFTN